MYLRFLEEEENKRVLHGTRVTSSTEIPFFGGGAGKSWVWVGRFQWSIIMSYSPPSTVLIFSRESHLCCLKISCNPRSPALTRKLETVFHLHTSQPTITYYVGTTSSRDLFPISTLALNTIIPGAAFHTCGLSVKHFQFPLITADWIITSQKALSRSFEPDNVKICQQYHIKTVQKSINLNLPSISHTSLCRLPTLLSRQTEASFSLGAPTTGVLLPPPFSNVKRGERDNGKEVCLHIN